MKKLRDIIRHNKFYTVLVIFIVLINFAIFAGRVSEKEKGTLASEEQIGEEAAEKRAIIPDEEEYKRRQEKIEDMAKQNPRLYLFFGIFNLLVFFVIFVGFLLDGYFISRWARKKPLEIAGREPEPPRWNVADIVKVVLIFMSFGYAFVIAEAFSAKFFPILRNENFRLVFDTAMMNLVGISVILYFIVKKYDQDIRAIGLTTRGFSKNIFYAVVGYVSLVPVLLVIMAATFMVIRRFEYEPPVQPIVQIFLEEENVSVLWLSSLFAAVFGPIAEEIFFRGFMYGAVKKTLGIFWAMVITSAIFSLLHTHIVGFLPIMALGLLLAYLYERTGSLVPSMAVHIMHNVGMVILVFLARSIGA